MCRLFFAPFFLWFWAWEQFSAGTACYGCLAQILVYIYLDISRYTCVQNRPCTQYSLNLHFLQYWGLMKAMQQTRLDVASAATRILMLVHFQLFSIFMSYYVVETLASYDGRQGSSDFLSCWSHQSKSPTCKVINIFTWLDNCEMFGILWKTSEFSRSAVKFFSKLKQFFFGYFDPINIFFDRKNKNFPGWLT